ncbi:MAG TPA: hypothetical protein VKT78_18230 [Fimbriimonadaceae bacterium]|nr:hypothetical protein [Fimbriimonadaceae bacterium]
MPEERPKFRVVGQVAVRHRDRVDTDSRHKVFEICIASGDLVYDLPGVQLVKAWMGEGVVADLEPPPEQLPHLSTFGSLLIERNAVLVRARD